jgi:hypothetical protein
MAVLSAGDRAAVLSYYAQLLSSGRIAFNLSKVDALAAVNATDDWIEANQAAFNAALPLAARTGLTTKQKVWLFFLVASRRYEVTP